NGGRIQINTGQLRFNNLDNRIIERTLDLSTAISATLTFNYTLVSGNESIALQLHDGSSYTTVQTLSVSTTVNYDLNPAQLTSSAGIRFISASGRWSFSETATIDNILFTVQFPDDPPVITAVGNQIYCPNGSLPIATSISITDPDDTSTSAAYIQISNGYVNGEDLLSLTGSHPNITASWDVVQGKLTLQGPTTYTEFEAAVLATEFSSSSPKPSGSRQFSITVGEANFLPVTQNYYEFVSDPGISWTAAETAAASRTYFGLQGYLVTLTSQEEADFSGAQTSGFGWIGATDVAVEGEWRWVTGPEAGIQFWQGLANGTELTFANWNGGEPNNAGGEDYAHIAAASVINGVAPLGAWNDLPNNGGGGAYASQGYVVEYGGMPGDPVLNISAITSLAISSCTVITNKRITYRVKQN
ncbi:MAG: hypothetical protein ACI9SG_002007, partial [Maribacter sp.]